jgi:hypothetical protein
LQAFTDFSNICSCLLKSKLLALHANITLNRTAYPGQKTLAYKSVYDEGKKGFYNIDTCQEKSADGVSAFAKSGLKIGADLTEVISAKIFSRKRSRKTGHLG